jgi:thermitase
MYLIRDAVSKIFIRISAFSTNRRYGRKRVYREQIQRNAIFKPSVSSCPDWRTIAQLPVIDTTTSRLLAVSIQAGDTAQAIASKYDARVLTFHPETGEAVLSLTKERAGRLSREAYEATDPNENTIQAQEDTEASSTQSNMGGWSTWGAGWSVYGAGQTSDLTGSPSTGPNASIWSKIRLSQGLSKARKGGGGMIVAVIDTGIDLAHPAFVGRLVSSDQMWDFVDNDAVPQEIYVNSSSKGYGHGTSVAGIVAQVAPNVKIMPLRVLGPTGSGDTDAVIRAIDWAVNHGADVINLSLGTKYLASLSSEINTATWKGVLMVCSTGNTGDTNVTFPASSSEYSSYWGDLTIGVGSTNLNDVKSSFSTYGDVEMTAIGENVTTPAPGNRVAKWSGTSMASPMVAGGLALALAERWYPRDSLLSLGRIMANTADDIDKFNSKNLRGHLGFGRLNLERFIQSALALPN